MIVPSNKKRKDRDLKICVLLTATIDTEGCIFLKRNDPKTRERDYINSLKIWMRTVPYPIIFCENSGHNLSNIKKIAEMDIAKNRKIEVLQLNANKYPRDLGKGYGELLTLGYVLKHSNIIKHADYLIKVTGRYIIKNFEEIEDSLRKSDDFYAMTNKPRKGLSWIDTITFAVKPAFIRKYLLKYQNSTDDFVGFYIEHALYAAIKDAAKKGHKVLYFKKPPFIYGYSGTLGVFVNGRNPFKDRVSGRAKT